MTIFVWVTNNQDCDFSRPGAQTEFVYSIQNSSYNLRMNNMTSFTLPAGKDAGIYKVSPEVGWYDWCASLTATSTVATYANQTMPYGYAGTLKLYSDSPFTRRAFVTAQSEANGPFVPVLTTVPAPPPPTPKLSLTSMGSSIVTLDAANLTTGYSYTIQRSDALLGWTNVQTFWATSTSQTLFVQRASTASSQFFRLHSP